MLDNNKYNIDSDACQQLFQDTLTGPTICSYGLWGLYGQPGSGKSYQLNQITMRYIQQSQKQQYNIYNPRLNNGEITYDIYLSPSMQNDMTFKRFDKTIPIQVNDDSIIKLCKFIEDVNNDSAICIEQQMKIITNQQIDSNEQKLIIKAIEQVKQTYPELKYNITQDTALYNKFKNIYQKYNIPFNGSLIRRPKIIIRFDDLQASVLKKSSFNSFFQLMKRRRHLGIWFCGLVLHQFSNATENLRTQQNYTLLFQGLQFTQLQDTFAEMPKIQTDDFGVEQFSNMYKTIDKHEFMVIQQSPQVYVGISWRVK